jgi:phage gp36-like protein
MVAYATTADFRLKTSDSEAYDVSDLDDFDRASIQAGRIEDALLSASGDIDSILTAIGYALPLPSAVYPQLVDICVWLAWEKLNTFGDRRDEVVAHADDARMRLDHLWVINPATGAPLPRQNAIVPGGDGKGFYNAQTVIGSRSGGCYVPYS